MTKLSMPVICECGFSTMDAKAAYDHALMHEQETNRRETRKVNLLCQHLDCHTNGKPTILESDEGIGIYKCPACGRKYYIIDNFCGRYYSELK